MPEDIDNELTLADIQAEVETKKHRNLWVAITTIVIACLLFIGYSVKKNTEATDPSVECAKIIGSVWVPEKREVLAGNVYTTSAYCNKK